MNQSSVNTSPYKVGFVIGFMIGFYAILGTLSIASAAPAPALKSPAVYETKLGLRDLWVEHIFWVRNYVDASHHNDANAATTAEANIVENAKNLGNSIERFYGKAASTALFNLLAGHWGAIKSYNDAVLENSKNNKDQALDALTTNARHIAEFLSNANPHLSNDAVYGLLSAHGEHHIAQIDAFAAQDFDTESKTWELMRKHMFTVADAIAEALARQFPEKFKP